MGKANYREMKQLVDRFDPTLVTWPDFSFKLETGGLELRRWFDEVEVRRHPDELLVTEAEPFADFILGGQPDQAIVAARRPALITYIESELAEHGPLRITKDRGMFVAQRRAG